MMRLKTGELEFQIVFKSPYMNEKEYTHYIPILWKCVKTNKTILFKTRTR